MNSNFRYSLQIQDFSLDSEYSQLREQHPNAGAIVTFSGLVRDLSKEHETVSSIELSTYLEMTEKQIQSIGNNVMQHFNIDGLTIIHRHGVLKPRDQIVMVGVASKHRNEAFSAAEMAMDFLKSQTAFWKKEIAPNSERWVEPTQADIESLKKWEK